jgi:dinuclear metal center YbgI/SA1388 family protein
MDIAEFDLLCRSLLAIEAFASIDDSLNGIQVGRGPGPIEKVAFAVDACAESIRRAAEAGAQVLFVHHGLFWGRPAPLDGALRRRVKLLLDADLALYACHLPLDEHPEQGNNAVLARILGLVDREGFGEHRGRLLGYAGRLDPPLSLDQALRRILPDGSSPLSLIPGAASSIRRAAVVSGGGASDVREAIAKGIDLFVTGESSHTVYHEVVEAGIHFLAAGHYATEVWGVRAMAERLAGEAFKTFFIDLPTGL